MLNQTRRLVAVSLLTMCVASPALIAHAQTDQWNALYDRIIRLEAQVRQGGAGGGGGNYQMQQQLQQLSAQVNALAQQMRDMQRELNRLRELEQQGRLFKNRKTASVLAPQQQSGQWSQQQDTASSYGQMEQSVTIDDGSAGTLPRGGLAPGPQTLGSIVVDRGTGAVTGAVPPAPTAPGQPQGWQAQPPAPQAGIQAPAPGQPQSWQVQPQPGYQAPQVQGVQSQTLPPPGGQAGAGQPRYQLQQGAQAAQPHQGGGFTPDSGTAGSLAPEQVDTAVLDGGAGGQNLGAGSTDTGGIVSDSAGRLFQQAKSSYRSRDFNGAVSGFRTFISRHKDHELAPEAQFLLGETYYAQSNWRLAAQTFLSGYQNYPKSKMRGQSLLKLAMSLNKLGQKKQACATFAEVNKKYAKQAAIRNASLEEMQRAGCG